MISKKDFKKINDYLWEIPRSFGRSVNRRMEVPARIYASDKIMDEIFEDQSIIQLINGTALPGMVKYGIAMPDIHEGYSVPIGFVGAIRASDGVISPGACGFDINCGMRLLKSDIEEKEIKPYLGRLADEIQKEIPSGLGQGRKAKLSLRQIDEILNGGTPALLKRGYGEKEDIENCEANGVLDWADAATVSSFAKNRGRNQVGTLGSGNHFLEIQKIGKIFDREAAKKFGLFENQIVLMIHTGSRGLGHQVCADYLKTMIPATERYGIKVPDKEFACVPFFSPEGRQYFKAMAAAANYAWSNRYMVAHYGRQAWKRILGEKEKLELLYDVAHNIIKKEEYLIDGKKTEVVVHRKGATRAFPPGHQEVPVKYRKIGQPVLIPGSMGTFSYILAGQEKGEESFFSVSHGAGRIMSRHQAVKTFSGQEVIKSLKSKNIIIRYRSTKNIAEESPLAYKNIEEVVAVIHNAGLARKIAKLTPLAVIKGE